MMEAELDEAREVTSTVQIERVDNGYQVRCAVPLKHKKTIRTMFGPQEVEHRTRQLVFSNLADVVKFLGEHYKEPTVGL